MISVVKAVKQALVDVEMSNAHLVAAVLVFPKELLDTTNLGQIHANAKALLQKI